MKKANMSTVVGFLLLAVGIILFIPFISDFSNLFSENTDSTTCSASLLSGTGKVVCPIKEAKITNEKVIIGKDIILKNYENVPMGNEGIAKLLINCLSEGGGVNSRSFSSNNYVSDEIVCIECYELMSEIPISDVTVYLKDAKKKPTQKTYLQSLTRDDEHLKAYMDFGSAFKLTPGENTINIEPNKPYSVFFMGKKKGTAGNIISKIGDVATGNFLGVFFENNDVYFTYLIESERLGEVCDRKVN